MRRLACTSLLALCGAAHALPPDQVVERVSPGVWALRTLDANNQPYNHGTAVAIAAGKAVTSCSVLLRATRIELRREQTVLAATLEFPDVERDLCQLNAPGLQAPEPARAAPRLGQRVYAIGYERGTDLAIVDGLYSRVRDSGTNAERIQTSVAGSAGLIGAGLYDEEARLLGIVTASPADAPAQLFALPSKWLAELPERGRAVLAARAAAPAKSAAGLPAVGAMWRYRYADHKYSNSQNYTVSVTRVEGRIVTESFLIDGSSTGNVRAGTVNADAMGFVLNRLRAERLAMEFSPYLLVRGDEAMREPWMSNSTTYPASQQIPWTVSSRVQGEEPIGVAAGSFKAVRVDVSGRRAATGQLGAGGLNTGQYFASRFLYQAWYAPEARRLVKVRHQVWNTTGQLIGDESIELQSFKPD